jgi:hypothetical protein
MKRIIKSTLLAGAVLLFTGSAWAQPAGGPPAGGPGMGNFDPAQMQQRMMERYREQLDVKSDDEWKLIQTRIEKVMTARREASSMGMMGMMGPRRQQPQGQDTQAATTTNANAQRRPRGGMFGQTPNPDAEALQKVIEAKGSKEEIKAKLDAYRTSMKTKQANLEKAQADLQAVLSVSQEAQCVLMGLLK